MAGSQKTLALSVEFLNQYEASYHQQSILDQDEWLMRLSRGHSYHFLL